MDLRNSAVIAGVVIIIGMTGALWRQSEKIDHLIDQNAHQTEVIQEQQLANKRLNNQVIFEREAVAEQTKISNQLRKRTSEKIESVRTIVKTEPCAYA